MEIYRRFIAELDAGSPKNGQKLTETLSEVDVSNPEDVKALIAADSKDVLVHFGDEDFLSRYKSFELHLPEWRQQYPKLASADMRYTDQIVLEMQKGTNTPLAGDAPANSSPENDAALAPAPVAVKTSKPAIKKPAPIAANKAKPVATAKAKPAPVATKAPVTSKPVATKAKTVASKPVIGKPAAGIKPTAAKPANIAGGPQ